MSVHDNIFQNYKDFNPFWRARSPSYLERRHQLFYTLKRRTPGLYSKASWALLVFCGIYCHSLLQVARKEKENVNLVSYEYRRKGLPFLQAVEDRRFLALSQKEQWIQDELFKDNKEEYLALSRIFHDPTVWMPPFERTSIYLGGIPTTYKGIARSNLTTIVGKDQYAKNIPGTHF